MHNSESFQENEMHTVQMELYLGQTTRHNDSPEKTKTCWIGDFAVPTDHRVKHKEGEKRHKYLDHTKEVKKLWNIKMRWY